ncbi:MAG: hypothetical protein SF123_07510 [Chloroflexota bacterium]|nr:hypothetical protein [Chloroflexota bacterium]
MGIQLDWEIENERTRNMHSGEDPEGRARRAQAFRRLLIVLLAMTALAGCIIWLISWRITEAENQVRSNLVITVENEVAALRIGDRAAFTSIQRSDSQVWLDNQQLIYNAYQTLKTSANVVLSGRVLNSEIDGPRGRVQVEEIIDGVQYVRTWFYFLYDDGWRHVPADYTFWGAASERSVETLTIRYFAVDAPFADVLAETLPRWLAQGCALVACPALPTMSVEVVPDEGIEADWTSEDPNRLQLSSPFIGPARTDALFTSGQQLRVGGLVAERLVETSNPVQPLLFADARYLRQAVISFMVERFTGIETNAFTIETLAETYGDQTVTTLLANLTPDASAQALAAAAGVSSIEQLSIDWRDYLTWRLALEQEVIAARDEANFLTLYDTADVGVRDLALARYNIGATGETWVVTQVVQETDAAGNILHRASAIVRAANGAERAESVLFRLVDGMWRRAS